DCSNFPFAESLTMSLFASVWTTFPMARNSWSWRLSNVQLAAPNGFTTRQGSPTLNCKTRLRDRGERPLLRANIHLGCRKRLTLYLQLFRVGMASWNRGFTRSMSKMSKRIFLYPYAGPGGRNYLKQIGTIQEIAATGIKLEEGALLSFYCDDAD